MRYTRLGKTDLQGTLQPPHHMFRRDIEAEILPNTAANDIGVLAYGPLAHGLLAGHMTFETPEGT
ncbi:MAG: hypothetical protein QOE89_2968 [Pseudonocardiales bacterium]|nr:hypothetical protein [Pseudonocardiales bacterium]